MVGQVPRPLADLPDGANISLYSDPANEAQGLWLLERAGLITLNPAVDKFEATQKDIVGNPKHLKFTLLDFAAQSRSLPDLDAAVGYTEYYLAAKVPLISRSSRRRPPTSSRASSPSAPSTPTPTT